VTRLTAPSGLLLRNPWGIAYDPALGDFLVTDSYFGTLLRVDQKTGTAKKLLEDEGLKRSRSLAVALGLGAFTGSTKVQGVVMRMSQTSGGAWQSSTFQERAAGADGDRDRDDRGWQPFLRHRFEPPGGRCL
jgi:streptogramin lyase